VEYSLHFLFVVQYPDHPFSALPGNDWENIASVRSRRI
jgi:hypothetical protein